jgi:hypothetical protein
MSRFWLASNLRPILRSCIFIYFYDAAIERISAFLLRPRDPVVRSGLFFDAVVLVAGLRFPPYTYERVDRDSSTQPIRPGPLSPSDLFSMYMMRFMRALLVLDV